MPAMGAAEPALPELRAAEPTPETAVKESRDVSRFGMLNHEKMRAKSHLGMWETPPVTMAARRTFGGSVATTGGGPPSVSKLRIDDKPGGRSALSLSWASRPLSDVGLQLASMRRSLGSGSSADAVGSCCAYPPCSTEMPL